jgi:hypothetical protein
MKDDAEGTICKYKGNQMAIFFKISDIKKLINQSSELVVQTVNQSNQLMI